MENNYNNQILSHEEILKNIPTKRQGEKFHIKVSKLEAEGLIANNIIPGVMNKEYGTGFGANPDVWKEMNKDDFKKGTYRFDDEFKTFEINVHPITKTNLQALLKEIYEIEDEINLGKEEIITDEQAMEEENKIFAQKKLIKGMVLVDSEGNEFTLKEKENGAWLADGRAGEKLIFDYDLKWFQIKNNTQNEIIGGKLKDLATEAIRNPESLKQFDFNTQETILKYAQWQEIKKEWMHLYDAVSPHLKENGWLPKQFMPTNLLSEPQLELDSKTQMLRPIALRKIDNNKYESLFDAIILKDKEKINDVLTSLNNSQKEYLGNPQNFTKIYEGLIKKYETIDNISASEREKKELANYLANIINQKSDIMETQKEFDQVKYLKDQMKYLGFGESEKLHKDLENGINSPDKNFEIKTTSDKTLPENKVDFNIKFSKSEQGGVFLNSYDATLSNDKGEKISQNFKVRKENTFTAKEAVNLLEGRSVKIEFDNPKTEQKETAFVKLNFAEDKNIYGNYNFQTFHQNYGVDTEKIVEKSNLIFDKPEYRDNTIKNLEKGNIVNVKFEMGDNIVEGKAILNPQYKNLSLYDNEMNRINTNEPIKGLENDQKHEKNNVREQSISRGI